MKSLLNQRYIWKISSKRLVDANWDLHISRNEALANNELVALASSNVLRTIDKLNGIDYKDKENKIKELKQRINYLKTLKNTTANRKKLVDLQTEFNKLVFMEDYMCVIMEKNSDYDKAIKGFKVNGIEYTRLLSTSAGVKKNVIVFTSKRMKEQLYENLNCERDLTKKFVPAKLEAYISLACSASLPVRDPKHILVVHDVETKFKDDVILVNGLESKRPKVTVEKDYETILNACDGLGLISPELAQMWAEDVEEDYLPSGMCIRNAFCKGMVYTFDFKMFAQEVAKTDTVMDVWGNEHDIQDVDLVLTTSMLKLWDSYSSIDDYLEKTKRNHFTFSLTKVAPEELDNEQTMNYQFLQSLQLDDEDIYQLIKPTLDEFDDILNYDYRKALLYLRGVSLTEKTVTRPPFDYTTAMMINPDMLNDPYTYSKIMHNIKNRIDQAKLGVINVHGNFSLLSGDPYTLCQAMFGLEVTGLLKRGEIYSQYWQDRGVEEVAGFRAPMSVHNNIVKMKIANNDEVNKWYKYMKTITILNAWDNTCATLNGCDFDGDTIMTTNNVIVLKGIKRLLPICCMQGSSSKIVPTEKDFIKANKASFGNAVGTITNYATSMYNVISNFEVGSPEYEELSYRLICMQDYQQAEIDKAKGVLARPVLKEWYDYKANKISENDSLEVIKEKEFNLKIMANKKPYFFIYNYDKLKKEFMDYYKPNNEVCQIKFGMEIHELRDKVNKTEEEEKFYENYANGCPVNVTPCLSNKIAWMIEDHFRNVDIKYDIAPFDKELLKNKDVEYSTILYNKVQEMKIEYDDIVQKSIKKEVKDGADTYEIERLKSNIHREFYDKCLELTFDEDTLCNILVDICYGTKKSKQFLWELFGEVIINNLLNNYGNKLTYPIQDENGDFTYRGLTFRMEETTL